ncbi:MAG: PspA/IM30 family protein [Clostridia bacterium]|jgi:phage shock protein A|nr:PspA/IM30 family protein [Clostridia bacterium]MBQ1435329.1 PspA/IM30 family protein [Clostridia bacterium]MBQ4249873.1 PspA/IM30 family protein [Clostridia bacterium]
MGILSRFGDIISSNINSLLDKAEDPAKMIDQYLREATENLEEVKNETATVIAEETRTRRLIDENDKNIAKYLDLAEKALKAGNEGDAKSFISKKQQLESNAASLQKSYAAAKENADKMRQLYNKLNSDIAALQARRDTVKANVAVAKTQETINKIGTSAAGVKGALSDFERMERKAEQMLDTANAKAELDAVSDVDALAAKYADASVDTSVDDELAAMKAKLGI